MPPHGDSLVVFITDPIFSQTDAVDMRVVLHDLVMAKYNRVLEPNLHGESLVSTDKSLT